MLFACSSNKPRYLSFISFSIELHIKFQNIKDELDDLVADLNNENIEDDDDNEDYIASTGNNVKVEEKSCDNIEKHICVILVQINRV